MNEVRIDESVRENWKGYPVRIRGLKVCCGKRTLLEQDAEGGFVKQICYKCKDIVNLSEADFKMLDLWVACPDCQKPMKARIVHNNYGYVCEQCDKYLKLATLLPRLKNLLLATAKIKTV